VRRRHFCPERLIGIDCNNISMRFSCAQGVLRKISLLFVFFYAVFSTFRDRILPDTCALLLKTITHVVQFVTIDGIDFFILVDFASISYRIARS